jgi:hypothetical protein
MIRRLSTALAAASLLTGCTIGFDTDQPDTFSCTDDSDCVSPFVCKGGVCKASGGTDCVDDDGDGYGVGDTSDCPECLSANKCEEDCNDDDPAVNPGLQDTCDGKDNDCDDEIDEPSSCETSADCPMEGSDVLSSCDGGVCVYKPALQTTAECREPLACVDGERQPVPDACR